MTEIRRLEKGDAMLGRCVPAAADELQADLLELGVPKDNVRAQRFCLRHGFRDTGKRKSYPLTPAAKELVMELQLKPQADRE
jgi:ribosomal protein S18 acetylase RimI-like enzyme